MFDIARMQRIDNRIRLIEEKISEDSLEPLEVAFPWLPKHWWADDRYTKVFEGVTPYLVKRTPPESPDFKKNWIPSVLKKYYPNFKYKKETVPLSVSITAVSHCITIEGIYRISFDPREVSKYLSPGLIIPIRFVNYIRKAERDDSRLAFGFNDDESKCFVIEAPLTLIKKHGIEVLEQEVKPYFGFSTL